MATISQLATRFLLLAAALVLLAEAAHPSSGYKFQFEMGTRLITGGFLKESDVVAAINNFYAPSLQPPNLTDWTAKDTGAGYGYYTFGFGGSDGQNYTDAVVAECDKLKNCNSGDGPILIIKSFLTQEIILKYIVILAPATPAPTPMPTAAPTPAPSTIAPTPVPPTPAPTVPAGHGSFHSQCPADVCPLDTDGNAGCGYRSLFEDGECKSVSESLSARFNCSSDATCVELRVFSEKDCSGHGEVSSLPCNTCNFDGSRAFFVACSAGKNVSVKQNCNRDCSSCSNDVTHYTPALCETGISQKSWPYIAIGSVRECRIGSQELFAGKECHASSLNKRQWFEQGSCYSGEAMTCAGYTKPTSPTFAPVVTPSPAPSTPQPTVAPTTEAPRTEAPQTPSPEPSTPVPTTSSPAPATPAPTRAPPPKGPVVFLMYFKSAAEASAFTARVTDDNTDLIFETNQVIPTHGFSNNHTVTAGFHFVGQDAKIVTGRFETMSAAMLLSQYKVFYFRYTTMPSSAPPSEHKGLKSGAIVGIVIGVTIVVAAMAGVWYRRGKRPSSVDDQRAAHEHLQEVSTNAARYQTV